MYYLSFRARRAGGSLRYTMRFSKHITGTCFNREVPVAHWGQRPEEPEQYYAACLPQYTFVCMIQK